jgi:predicted Zn-dependent peptidase
MPGVQIHEVESEIEKILNDIIQGNITINELAKIKNRIETRYAYRMQSIVNKADMLAHYKIFYNNPSMVNSNIERYLSLTVKDIEESANIFLKPENRVVLIYMPKKKT